MNTHHRHHHIMMMTVMSMMMMVMLKMMMLMMIMIPNESFSPESGGRVKARMAMDAIRMQGIIRLKKLGSRIEEKNLKKSTTTKTRNPSIYVKVSGNSKVTHNSYGFQVWSPHTAPPGGYGSFWGRNVNLRFLQELYVKL